ncbi:MAG: GLUG motif-containing protein, partial [Prevotellaceae bacterium]|nr:GLUG motif-containing protein [Prevotellaceae bacterium]
MKRYVLFLAALLNVIWASAQYSGSGNGTETDPYLIYNTTQLYQMNNFLGSNNAGVVFKLMKDLDLSEFINDNFPSQGWSPIGVETAPFQGKFYGNNHTLSGLWINRNSTNNVGLFGYVGKATIRDLKIESTYVYGSSNVGTLVGYATGATISNCHISGKNVETVKGTYVGGLAGYILGSTTITDCRFEGSCIKSSTADSYAGGFVGYADQSTITSCIANTNINANANTGGICGCISGRSTVENCNYEGGITANTNVGGIVGTLNILSEVRFKDSHSKGTITNTSDYTGGIIGNCNGGCIAGIESCSHFGDINGKNYIGGIIGAIHKLSDETIYISTSNTKNTEERKEPSSRFVTGSDKTPINNCASIGNINGENHIGGVIGWEEEVLAYNNGTSKILEASSSIQEGFLWYGDRYTGKKAKSYSVSNKYG